MRTENSSTEQVAVERRSGRLSDRRVAGTSRRSFMGSDQRAAVYAGVRPVPPPARLAPRP